MQELEISNSRITDNGVAMLKNYRSLERLALPGSRVTDDCIPTFNSLSRLTVLDLRNTAITDVGLMQFFPEDKGGYRRLHVGGTRVTRQGATEFLRQHPNTDLNGVDGLSPSDSDFESWLRPLLEENESPASK